MKTTTLKTTIGAGLALAVAIAVWTPANTFAQEKGATRLASPILTSSPRVEAPVMACPKCETEYATRVDTTVRGVNKPTLLIANHECTGCSSTVKQVGTGKAAQNVTAHTCVMDSKPSNCCQ